MIDKLWYEWQNRNSASATSFFGGSVQHLDNEADYQKYPNGGPPYLSVSTRKFNLMDSSGFLIA
jgi:tyrosinase